MLNLLNNVVKRLKWSKSVSCSAVSDSLRPHGLQVARLLCLWDFLGKNAAVDSHSLLQRMLLTQGSYYGL